MDVVDVFTITTGIVLASAALFAYLIQRARYLREFEPDLELTWPEVIQIIEMPHSLKEFWAVSIDLGVHNISNNPATGLRWQCELEIFPERGRASYIETTFSNYLPISPSEILPGREIVVPVYIGWNLAKGLYEKLHSWEEPIETEKAGFRVSITIEYYSRPEILMFIIWPFGLGRKKYQRDIEGWWGFTHGVPTRSGKPRFVSLPWRFPEESLQI